MSEWLTGSLVTAGLAVAGFIISRWVKKADESISKADLEKAVGALQKECLDHRGNCNGPGWMKEAISKVNAEQVKTNTNLERLIGRLEGKGVLEAGGHTGG